MEFYLSLYDALVGAQVPPDKARQVVDALQKHMFDQLATKSDLQLLETRLRHDLLLRLGAIQVAASALLFAALRAFG